ncbi:hypothetical protein BDV59DRAFT_187052 [Aspergillus ambiguus]|uniref:uncharacterized protein n=1 Tax=Aspergillus ambiguus TaxID=176160 RepID=UPI003CCCE233
MCENHWTIVFKYGGEKVAATKHRGYDLKWRKGNCPVPLLRFDIRRYCPSMSDIAWKICATEYPDTKAHDCVQFV